MIFESHAHYDDDRFLNDRYEVLDKLKGAGVEIVINVGSDLKSSVKSIELSKRYNFVYAAVGIHPHEVKDLKEEDLETLLGLLAYNKVVAIGEIGLDYYYENSPIEIQKLWFREQINIAKGVELPLIIHSRDAAHDTYEILKNMDAGDVGGVIHCYSGSKEMAMDYVDMGFYIGIGGVITFSKAKKLKEVVNVVPLDRILLETDSPYLAPEPKRGKRNDSTYLKYIVAEIARIKGVSEEEVIKTTYDNGMKLFIESI